MTGFAHLGRLYRGALPLAAALLVAGAIGCGGGESEPAATEGAAAEISQMEKGTRKLDLPGGKAATVTAEEMPEDYPADLPAPPGAAPKNTLFIPGQFGMATFVSDRELADLQAYFENEFPSKGWTLGETESDANRTVVQASKGSRKARVVMISGAEKIEIAITLQEG